MTRLFTLIQRRAGALSPERCKLHLATPPDNRTNLRQMLADGKFDEWQSYQTKRLFISREFLVALIQDRDDRWIFAGACAVEGLVDDDTPADRRRAADELHMPTDWGDWMLTACHHRLRRVPACDDLIGTIVRYRRRVRCFHPFAEQLASQLEVHEADQKD